MRTLTRIPPATLTLPVVVSYNHHCIELTSKQLYIFLELLLLSLPLSSLPHSLLPQVWRWSLLGMDWGCGWDSQGQPGQASHCQGPRHTTHSCELWPKGQSKIFSRINCWISCYNTSSRGIGFTVVNSMTWHFATYTCISPMKRLGLFY